MKLDPVRAIDEGARAHVKPKGGGGEKGGGGGVVMASGGRIRATLDVVFALRAGVAGVDTDRRQLRPYQHLPAVSRRLHCLPLSVRPAVPRLSLDGLRPQPRR